MSTRATPILHRNDPAKAPLIGHVKVTRQDWLNMARDVLVTEGVGEVKILGLATLMGVSRSSFYWYFKDRADLLDALLTEWAVRNTTQITAQCRQEAATITGAICNFFRCFIDPAQFDRGLDFAIREWSRRDDAIRHRVDCADSERIAAVVAMFQRYDYTPGDADARARILYYMQLGYHALEVSEPMQTRMSRLDGYIRGFSGQEPEPDAIAAFLADVARFELG